MSSGFHTKTRTCVNCFPHADPVARAHTHPTRTSVQHSLVKIDLGDGLVLLIYLN